MHPFHSQRGHKTARHRVKHILKGHMRGGHAKHEDVAEDKALIKKMIKEHEHKVHGMKKGGRLDKYARGGAAKKKHGTQVNIAVVAPHGRSPSSESAAPAPGGILPPPGGGLPMPPPGGAGLPPGLPPGMPPGMAPRPGMMNRGGTVKPAKMKKGHYTGGAESGVGRKEKARAYGLKPKRGR